MKASLNYKIDTNKDYFDLIAIGDFHIGHKGVDYELLAKSIKDIKRNRDCRIILMGDTIENAIPGSVSSPFESEMTPEEQLDLAYELLKPISGLVLGLHCGNHGERSNKATGLSPEKMLASRLSVPFLGHQALTTVSLNGIIYTIFTAHGVSGAQTAGGVVQKLMQFTRMAEADVYLMGHVHQRVAHIERYQKVVGRQTVFGKRVFATSPSFLEYHGSYAEKMLLKPGAMGHTVISLGATQFDLRVGL